MIPRILIFATINIDKTFNIFFLTPSLKDTHVSEGNDVGVAVVAVEYLDFLLAVPGALVQNFDGVLGVGGLVGAPPAHAVRPPPYLLAQVVVILYAGPLDARHSL